MGLSLPDQLRARMKGQAYWQVRYRDGRVLSEWEDGVNWLEIPRGGLVQGRLICPNGQVVVLGNTAELGDRLFQFNIASANVGLGGAGMARRTHTKVMGLLTDTHGNCELFAWEYDARRLVGPIQDNVGAGGLTFGGPATSQLCFDHLRVKPD